MYRSFAWMAAVREDPLRDWTTPAEMSVLNAVFSVLDNQTGKGWAARSTLARKARVHPSTVSEVLAKAEERGWLRIVRDPRRANRFTASTPRSAWTQLPGALKKALESVVSEQRSAGARRPVGSDDPFSHSNSEGGGPSSGTGPPPRELSSELEEKQPSPGATSMSELRRRARLLEVLTETEMWTLREALPADLTRSRIISPWDLGRADPSALADLFDRHPEIDGDPPSPDKDAA